MTTIPIPTGKIRGSLRDVTPKLRNFVGAVKVTTQSGKGGILVDMGKPVAAYLTVEGVLHRGKESLELLEKEELAEFEILRYDEEQFREAMIICDNRGLLLAAKLEETRLAPGAAEQEKPKKETVLTSMMKRFAAPKIGEKQEPSRAGTKMEAETPGPAPVVGREEPKLPEPVPPIVEKKELHIPEGKEVFVNPPQETELSAIIRRLRESSKIEKGSAPPPDVKAEDTTPMAGVPEPEWKAKAAELVTSRVQRPPTAIEEKTSQPVGIRESVTAGPGDHVQEGRVRVDLGKMMKRIKRLDITSIREELEAGAESEGGAAGGGEEAPPAAPGAPETPATVPVRAPAPPADIKGKSDIDELKAFIQRLEVLEQPGESPPPEKGLFARLGVKPQAAEAPAPPRKREIPVPVPKREKAPEDMVAIPEVKAEPRAPEAREAPRPAEPDRKAKIASLLRRSGLVKPPAEEPGELISEITVEPAVPEEKEKPPAPPEEVEIRVPRPQRKKVEITRVPKKPEKPLREPPLLDERTIQKILKQPGVIAVSTFFEGFAVQSAGRADFEQVAANAEDLFRAGKKIAREIDIGPLNQIILETGRGKLIIAPYGDLNVCIFTEAEANLGLIRVAIKSMQVDTG